MISIIIPTRWTWDFTKLWNLLKSLDNQTMKPEEILIIIDFDIPRVPLLNFLGECNTRFWISWETVGLTKVVCQEWYYVSAARNRWVRIAKSEFCLLCDDDIVLHENDCLERMVDEYALENKRPLDSSAQYITSKDWVASGWQSNTVSWWRSWLILYPTILFHNTNQIQSQGFSSYNRFMCRPVPKYGVDRKSKLWKWLPSWLVNIFGGRDSDGLQCIGTICVFASRDVLLKNPWDEKFSFVYEDIERSYRARKQWIQIINNPDIQIQHREKQKWILARSYIDTPENCYRKTRHRIWFVLRHANRYQKIMFYACGFRLSNGWTLMYILLYAPRKRWNNLIRSRWRGIVDGLRYEN